MERVVQLIRCYIEIGRLPIQTPLVAQLGLVIQPSYGHAVTFGSNTHFSQENRESEGNIFILPPLPPAHEYWNICTYVFEMPTSYF